MPLSETIIAPFTKSGCFQDLYTTIGCKQNEKQMKKYTYHYDVHARIAAIT